MEQLQLTCTTKTSLPQPNGDTMSALREQSQVSTTQFCVGKSGVGFNKGMKKTPSTGMLPQIYK